MVKTNPGHIMTLLTLSLGTMPSFCLSSSSPSSSPSTVMEGLRTRAQTKTAATTSGGGGAPTTTLPPPIVYTIAGSDSGGGAGIQADLHAMHAMGCHGCSAITCLTAQNSVGVTAVHAPPSDFLQEQLQTLQSDLPPTAIKIGMLANKELVETVAEFVKQLIQNSGQQKVWVVLDPVMISTSGSRLIEQDAQQAMEDKLFPYVDVLTPNKFEAEALVGKTLDSPKAVEAAAQTLLQRGCRAVLIKGGHTLQTPEAAASTGDTNLLSLAQDYLLLAEDETKVDGEDNKEPRLCDGASGVWLQSRRYETEHTHGTGCTLSSALASALALGEQARRQRDNNQNSGTTASRAAAGDGAGAMEACWIVDACCLAKAYVTAGIAAGVELGQGPGPVVQTSFPRTHSHFPTLAQTSEAAASSTASFRRLHRARKRSEVEQTNTNGAVTMGRLLPIVDSVEWVQRLCDTATKGSKGQAITDIQLRIKHTRDQNEIEDVARACQAMCEKASVRLWINDNWEAALAAQCFGVHLGQEDLCACMQAGGLERLQRAGMALGISTHSYAELAAALSVRPSYISLGPVFGTDSKRVAFGAQGLATVQHWRQLIPPDMPLVAIGGIQDPIRARTVSEAGADCAAVIGAITRPDQGKPDDDASLAERISDLNQAMQ